MTQVETAIAAGHVLGGRYRVAGRLGVGGMAEVFLAQDTTLERQVAVKMLLPKYADDELFNERFLNEAKSAGRLSSPYIVAIHDWGRDRGRCYIVMEYVKGTNIKKWIRSSGAIHPVKAAEIASQVCSALHEAHRKGIVHRDIKSSNVMMQEDGNIKIMDFGIAQAEDLDDTLTSGSVMGTVHYMSPEQIRGKTLDASSDLYSLGIVMYEMTTGSLPFRAQSTPEIARMQLNDVPPNPRTLDRTIPAELERIIMKAVSKDPQARYESAAAMQLELEAFLADAPLLAQEHSSAPRRSAYAASQESHGFWAIGILEGPPAVKGRVFKFSEPVVLGRSADADIRLQEKSVSGQHVRLSPQQDAVLVEDLGSSNGTHVNGHLAPAQVSCAPGDRLQLGRVQLVLGRG